MDSSKGLEERSAKVKDEVDTSPLLHHLQRGSKNCATQIAARIEDTAAEAVEPAVEVAALRNNR